jgi:colanic acid biosynthesis glycosyl transferase WcaI
LKILIVSEFYWPETIGAGVLVSELSEFLALRGYDITVQTAYPHIPTTNIWKNYNNCFFSQEIHNLVKIRRSYVFAVPKNKPIILRAFSALSFAISALISQLFCKSRFDIIYTISPIMPLALSSIMMGFLSNTPVIFGVKDLSVLALVQSKKIKATGVFRRALEFFEISLYKCANHIQVPSANQKSYLMQHGIKENKISIITDWANSSEIKPLPKNNSFRNSLMVGDKILIVYAGNIGYSSDLGTIVKAASLLGDEQDIVFLIIGDGVELLNLKKLAQSYRLTNILFLPFQAREIFPEVLASADIGLITLNSRYTNVASQGKMYSIMSAGRPILAVMDHDAWGAQWISDYGIGKRVDPGDFIGVVDAINQWKHDPEGLKVAGNKSRDILLRNFSLTATGESFISLFKKVILK